MPANQSIIFLEDWFEIMSSSLDADIANRDEWN